MTPPSSWRRFKQTFLTGLFIIGPFSLTLIVISWFVSAVDQLLAPVVGFIGHPIPGLGIAAAVVLVWVTGLLAGNLVGQHLLELVEDLLLKIPVFNWFYRTFKQLSEVFSPGNKAAFRGVVLIEYPRPHVYSVGFVTNRVSLERAAGKEELACVYVPTNHMYIGDTLLVPESQVIPTSMSHQEGVQAALSAGAALPPLIKGSPKN